MAIALPTHLQDGEAILVSGSRLLQKMADGKYRALARQVDIAALNLDQFKSDSFAWVTFDGRGASPTILAKHNVQSIIDLGVGLYRIVLNNAYPDTTYGTVICADGTLANGQFNHHYVSSLSTSGPTIACASITNGTIRCDPAYVTVIVSRDPTKI